MKLMEIKMVIKITNLDTGRIEKINQNKIEKVYTIKNVTYLELTNGTIKIKETESNITTQMNWYESEIISLINQIIREL